MFPHGLKHIYVTAVNKKKGESDKTNYRLVNILTNISEIYENLIYKQFNDYFDDTLSPSQCGFCKGYRTQHCLLVMLEKFKESDKDNEFVAP